MNLAMKYFKDCQRQPRLISRKTLRMAQPSPSTIKHAEEKTRIRKNWTQVMSAVIVDVYTIALGHLFLNFIMVNRFRLHCIQFIDIRTLLVLLNNKWECTQHLIFLSLHFSIDALVKTNVPLRRVVVNIVGIVEEDLLTPSGRVARLGLQIMKLKYE